ncbi:hypothetical protein RFI_00624 [Reticulomyxa filosa]|uniref:Uncharacterized protein n=1 Tax=Reticulomyxa filosa TaxID=46433 RepID=X6PEB7_RETFI|nr:hypothetical protein RFI_00624 [Reticulomyxa filosa]|eukprot:ETO36438.1 hypothetical protein RFI_00624 [Reticulomyxa filosa]
MITHNSKKQTSTQSSLVSFITFFKVVVIRIFFVAYEKKETQLIIRHWIRILKIKLGWINEFDKLVVNYATTFFMLDTFCSSSKVFKIFTGHTDFVNSIDYFTLDGDQLLCSGSDDKTVRVWNIETNKQIQLCSYSNWVSCVIFSQYHYHNYRRNVICSSLGDNTIQFWDIKYNQQFQIFDEHTDGVSGIEFSSFNGGRYLCSGSFDNTICLWDVETSKSLYIFNGHEGGVWCVSISPLQSNNNDNINNKSNNIGVIGGNGYTICSGSWVELFVYGILKQQNNYCLRSVKYGSNELGNIGGANTILSGSSDQSVRLWDIRSGQQIQVFNGHKNYVYDVEYSPFVIKNNIDAVCSNVICSGSRDNTIRFWDIRSNKKKLYMIKGDKKEENGIKCLKFVILKKKGKKSEQKLGDDCSVNLCYGSTKGPICIWG